MSSQHRAHNLSSRCCVHQMRMPNRNCTGAGFRLSRFYGPRLMQKEAPMKKPRVATPVVEPPVGIEPTPTDYDRPLCLLSYGSVKWRSSERKGPVSENEGR